jgi:hypothetical protein
MSASDVVRLIHEHLASPKSSWHIGAFGAIAEFHRHARETISIDGCDAVTERGAIAIQVRQNCRAYAYELPSAREHSWLHGVALCLPENEALMSRRTTITEIGPDLQAIRPEDRAASLFDLGLGVGNCDFCVRTADPELKDALRSASGLRLLENDALFDLLVRRSPHRVVLSRLGRIEVYQRIAAHDERSPDGPHTHLLPRLVRQRRTHIATLPIPAGWVPCLNLYPPNPVLDDEGRPKAFDANEHGAFQDLLERFGHPEFMLAKRSIMTALRECRAPDAALLATRVQRTAHRVALRQLRLQRV